MTNLIVYCRKAISCGWNMFTSNCHISPFMLVEIKADNIYRSRFIPVVRGTGVRGLITGMATVPQGNQELLVVRHKVGRPKVSLG